VAALHRSVDGSPRRTPPRLTEPKAGLSAAVRVEVKAALAAMA
jgi:hypothetical protein